MSPEPPSDPKGLTEAQWLATVYRPSEAQLTVRAALVGMAIGVVMCLSNLYVVLKTGWSVGVTLIACVMAWSLFAVLQRLGLSRREFGILENNAMGSVASAAGYMTGGGNMAALPALVMLTGVRPDPWMLVLWFALVAGLGVFAAIPIKRQLINKEQLPFPTGTATAQTLKALHAHGQEGRAQASLLFGAMGVGAVVVALRDLKAAWMPWNLPSTVGFPFTLRGKPAAEWTLGVEGGTLMLAVGALMSWRTGWSVLLGTVGLYGFLAPAMVDAGVITTVSYKAIVGWSLWLGASILLASGLTAFALDWRSVARSLSGLTALLRPGAAGGDDEAMDRVEAPTWWLLAGFLVLGPPLVLVAWYLFDIPPWAGALALPLALTMGVVAARVTGETDVTPTKALGPVTQATYGLLLPGQLVPNIMAANITGGVGLHAADLLTDLKSGYLLGARPRPQVLGQLLGVVAGAAVVVPAFNLLVPEVSVLGSQELPAPAAQVWASVSRTMVSGLGSLHESARWAALVGLALGVALALAERYAPRSVLRFVPSPSGLGIALVVPGFNGVMIFLGALLAHAYRSRVAPGRADEVVQPVASGLIAGESLVGIAIKLLVAVGLLAR